METGGVASRATRNLVDTHIFDSQREQLCADCGAQVHPGLAASRCNHEPDLSRDVVADLEAARTDARANRRNCRQSLQPFDTGAHDAENDATPSGMNRHDVAARFVGDENGHTIGHAHAHGDADGCRANPSAVNRPCPPDDGVSLFKTAFGRVDGSGAMHLPDLGDGRRTERAQQFRLRRVARRKPMGETHLL